MSDMKLSEAPIPLSQAIRLGAMLRPQATGRIFLEGASCAQGAAIEALGIDSYGEYNYRRHGVAMAALSALYPDATRRACPIADCGVMLSLVGQSGLIAHLNDHRHSWTREAIADWVETIEQAQSSATPKEVFATKESV